MSVMPSRCMAMDSFARLRVLCTSNLRTRLRLVVEAVGLGVFGDIGVDEKDFAVLGMR